jgi:hypothetical protein
MSFSIGKKFSPIVNGWTKTIKLIHDTFFKIKTKPIKIFINVLIFILSKGDLDKNLNLLNSPLN